ncbi:hypothetical protein DN069_27885 [Streptacidiphilus pinicola]|uniref:Lipoprotein n=1 Tax=Streptacidiphilus pinicola TaxID=2219663 RepID=A0A2X0JZK3_9ACTN|nr:hypothetical protein [Streptacidiphilus pinicola]RAG82385.1 hypothetical protein DN069_27885 [Streptacidiphilus pinicola]
MRRTAIAAPLLAVALAPLLVGAAPAVSPVDSPPTGPYTVGVIDTDTQGRVFTDPDFLVVYHDINDNPAGNTFDCATDCLKLYHPLLTTPGAVLTMPPGVSGTLSSVVRPDGVGDQVTINGYPVYTFSGDQPGATGGLSATWHAVPAPVQPPPPVPAN